jgi:hypothetical protein
VDDGDLVPECALGDDGRDIRNVEIKRGNIVREVWPNGGLTVRVER